MTTLEHVDALEAGASAGLPATLAHCDTGTEGISLSNVVGVMNAEVSAIVGTLIDASGAPLNGNGSNADVADIVSAALMSGRPDISAESATSSPHLNVADDLSVENTTETASCLPGAQSAQRISEAVPTSTNGNTAAAATLKAVAAFTKDGLEVKASVARLVGVDAALGGEAHGILCLEMKGLATKAAHEKPARAACDVVLVVDVSGSMCSVMTQVQETMKQVFFALSESDRIGVVTFESTATVVLPLTKKDDAKNWSSVVAGVRAGGGTNIEDALQKSFRVFDTAADSSRRRSLLVLSDGEANQGMKRSDGLCALAQKLALQVGRVTIHSLGFTASHDIEVMSGLPRASSAQQGGYYYLGSSDDIGAAVGDCLGLVQEQLACEDVSIELDAGCRTFGPQFSIADEVPLLSVHDQVEGLDGLRVEQRQVRLIVVPQDLKMANLKITWKTPANGLLRSHRLTVLLEDDEDAIDVHKVSASTCLTAVRVVAHVLRLQVAAALAVLADGLGDIGNRYDSLHEAVLRCAAALESVGEGHEEEEEVVFLEGMLQALERDLGEALTDRHGSNYGHSGSSREERGVLLSFAQEHFSMHSSSSLTRNRAAYASREQICMRLKFLQSGGGVSHMEAKSKLALEGHGLTKEELICRQATEDINCFVNLTNWREGIIGLGLFVHPRTLRERRNKLAPEVDIVVDYVSAEAFNLGIRTSVQSGPTHYRITGNEEDDEQNVESERPALPSSARRRINAWLPCYVNATNWEASKMFAPSAFSLISTQLNSVFRPEDALSVCARLLCCTVVGFVRPGSESKPEQQRAAASEKAIQMYCDVHRLLLEMVQMFPEIHRKALKDVRGFINDPSKRTRRATPNLGDLIAYLSIIDEVSWADLEPVFVPEMVRRAATRFDAPFDAKRCRDRQAIIDRFDELQPEHGKVILFYVIFNKLVARPVTPWDDPVPAVGGVAAEQARCVSHSCAEVRQMYDRRWGSLPEGRRCALFEALMQIRALPSVSSVLQELISHAFSTEDVCELILWADKNAGNPGEINAVPNLRKMPRLLTDEWLRHLQLEASMKQEVLAMLAQGIPPQKCLHAVFHCAAKLEGAAGDTQKDNKYLQSSKEEACAVAAVARQNAANARQSKAAEARVEEERLRLHERSCFVGNRGQSGKSSSGVCARRAGSVTSNTIGCKRCGCTRELDAYGDRICFCDVCKSSGCTTGKSDCKRCGCTQEFDGYGDRICFCDTCRRSGCTNTPSTFRLPALRHIFHVSSCAYDAFCFALRQFALSNPARELGTESSILSGGCRRRARLPHAARIENTQEKKPVQEEEVDEIEVMLNPEHWQAEVERLRQEGLPNCRMLRGLKQTGRKGETRTVNDLRQQICKLMHLEDFRMVRLLLWKRFCTPASWQPGEAESFAEMAGCAYSETGGKASVTCLTPSSSLSLYDFRNAFIEVKKRKRGGKKTWQWLVS